MNFKLKSPFQPTGDQPRAVRSLTDGLEKGLKSQVLLGVTGSGKTFTMAKVIEKLNKPTLIISHNKTLAAQLYQEFHEFFPENAVSYFVSYYDFYQPEAYIPRSDTYIEKETEINEEIGKLRLSATTNLLTRADTIVVASVSCIYSLGNPEEYGKFVLELACGAVISREAIFMRLVDLQYQRSDFGFHRSTFRVRGENIDVFLAYEPYALRIKNNGQKIISIKKIDPLTGKVLEEKEKEVIYPAKHYLSETFSQEDIFKEIQRDLEKRCQEFKKDDKLLESHRLNQKVNFDLEMIREMGYVNGIENYSRYFDGRKPGDPPYTLLDYFNKPYGQDWLLIIDESHISVPQIRGMYNGDRSRKQVLCDYGFRLPSALDNRPLRFEEFLTRIPRTVFISATPADWEIRQASESAGKKGLPGNGIAEQLIRPTGITDPKIQIRPTKGQIIDLVSEILERKKRNERVLVTTLTKRMAEDLADYIKTEKYRDLEKFKNITDAEAPLAAYLHSDIETLERSDILDDLRAGKYDCLIGINLLREGLDLPEVSLVAILDADKEGFLRSETSLIQTMGRAARHIEGRVIMYADNITGSMQRAISEIDRRRRIQKEYNQKNKITATQIVKPIRAKLVEKKEEKDNLENLFLQKKEKLDKFISLDPDELTPFDLRKLANRLEHEMKKAAAALDFELAASIRDKIREIKTRLGEKI